MLDVAFIRKHPDRVRQGIAAKGETADVDWFLQQDRDLRAVVTELDDLRARQNQLSPVIGQKKRSGADAEAELAEVADLKTKIKHLEERRAALEQDLHGILMRLPNLPAEDVPAGRNEDDNVVVETWGAPREFAFEPRPHWEIGEALGVFHPEAAARMSGSGFSLTSGALAQLERALWSFMLDLHTREHGYTEVASPYLVLPEALEGTSQLPKFETELYRCRDDQLYLIPTAEVPLTNMHREQILEEEQLPLRVAGFTPCFRREAGAAGRDTRGLLRVHQFHKVELMVFSHPDHSDAEQVRIRGNAEAVLRALKLPYRVVFICAGDSGFGSRRQFDLELWAPGVAKWLEISSISSFGDFQARRARIRYRPTGGGKPRYVHTLNGSGVALPRLLVALLENYQREDGSVEIPEVLRPYMWWQTEITA